MPVTIKDLETHKLTLVKILTHFSNLSERIDSQLTRLKAERKPTAAKPKPKK